MNSANPQTIIKPVLSHTADWFSKALPEPTKKNFSTQLGVHFEEVREMIQALNPLNPVTADIMLAAETVLHTLALHLKQNENVVAVKSKIEYLDAICDQIVTATGCGYNSRLDVVGGLNEVNRSNFSKFVNGVPIYDENQKIAKGPDYSPADLSAFV